MIKILGAAAVFLSCAAAGQIMARELYERTKLLKELEQSAIYIKSELEYRTPVFEECFRGRGRLFSKAAKYIGMNMNPKEALKKAARETEKLRDEDRELIYDYADGLDAEDVGAQTANVSLLITRLECRIREAEEERGIKSRLYKSGGALAGIGLVILLL